MLYVCLNFINISLTELEGFQQLIKFGRIAPIPHALELELTLR